MGISDKNSHIKKNFKPVCKSSVTHLRSDATHVDGLAGMVFVVFVLVLSVEIPFRY